MTETLPPHDVFLFAPKEDITAYELSVIFMGMSENVFGEEPDKGSASLRIVPRLVGGPIIAYGVTLNQEPKLRRHFVPHTDPIRLTDAEVALSRLPWLSRVLSFIGMKTAS